MMPYPDRLYYTDAYLTRFRARVVERLSWQGHPAVVLDQTAFYPTSGGQPADRGALCGVAVIDVQIRPEDGAVVHLLESGQIPDQVDGEVDWIRRFDHMQQHTGQHLLSAACEQLLDADTVSFHLGADTSTIDLDAARIPVEAMEEVEDLVNRIVWENRPVRSRFVTPQEAMALPLRRAPQVEGPIRLVEIADFDLNPCGGTHVARTGEIGLIKVLRLDYRADETRVEFVCGRRALLDYRAKNDTIRRLSTVLTVGYWELEDAVCRLQEGLRTAQRELRAIRQEMLDNLAERLVSSAPEGTPRVVKALLEGYSPSDLRVVAQQVIAHPRTVALLASVEERVYLCAARSEDIELDVRGVLRSVCNRLRGKGGGQPHFAQGSAPLHDPSEIEAALAEAASTATTDLSSGVTNSYG